MSWSEGNEVRVEDDTGKCTLHYDYMEDIDSGKFPRERTPPSYALYRSRLDTRVFLMKENQKAVELIERYHDITLYKLGA